MTVDEAMRAIFRDSLIEVRKTPLGYEAIDHAIYDGSEETCHAGIGYGETPEAAVANLLEDDE